MPPFQPDTAQISRVITVASDTAYGLNRHGHIEIFNCRNAALWLDIIK